MTKVVLITESPYYPVFFRHHFTEYEIFVIPFSFSMEEIEKSKPDFVILDDHGVKESIFDICHAFKERKKLQHLPLFIISGNLKKEYHYQLMELGIQGIVQIPLNEKDMKEEFRKAISYQKRVDFPILDFSTSLDLRFKSLFNKGLLDPAHKTIADKKPISLLAISVEYNDIHEYTEQQIHKTLKQVIKNEGLILSLGQGKYLVILIETALPIAKYIAETLEAVITETMHIGIAIGISSQKKPPYANIQEMIQDAKIALMNAQKKGTAVEVFP